MILYTTMPQELIFPTDEAVFQKQTIVDVKGVSVLVNEERPGEHYVVRILSSNPADYLNEQLYPGQKITMMH